MRLNKYIALCGAASRRGADKLIADGRVTVNGGIVLGMGTDIDIQKDTVCVNGAVIRPQTENVYIMLNKPEGYICACSDDRGRRTVIDLIDGIDARIFPVGRLDYDTEGLLLLTNDGDFAYRCTHPKHEVNKKYYAVARGVLNDQAVRTLCGGVTIEGVKTSKAEIEIVKKTSKRTEMFITIHEGRNRQIKKMFQLIGCHISYLKRVAIGDLELGDLATGKWRCLKHDEINLL
ncbi:MAG: pseudouridine synthase [Eubacteriales bacterium]|nr:pseudouridine synthase [Eubacteriales bacterium]